MSNRDLFVWVMDAVFCLQPLVRRPGARGSFCRSSCQKSASRHRSSNLRWTSFFSHALCLNRLIWCFNLILIRFFKDSRSELSFSFSFLLSLFLLLCLFPKSQSYGRGSSGTSLCEPLTVVGSGDFCKKEAELKAFIFIQGSTQSVKRI